MTHSTEDLHVYLRSITAGERTSLSVLASLIHSNATVLDLGCGSGALGQHVTETQDCIVDGVTLSEAEATHAKPYYRRVVVDNLESCDLVATFEGQRYDYIVCADVLEHLSRPEKVLDACHKLLKTNGKLLISVPNAGYSGLIAELLEGEFLYREEGLLDRTHLRFFTRKSLQRFLGEHRWASDSIDTIVRELPESEFDVAFDRLPPSVARHLLGVPDALTYQFICVAHPTAEAAANTAEPTARSEMPVQALFTTQLYLGYAGRYDEAHKLTASGVIGKERQTLCFDLPDSELPVTQLRLDPADRPGFVHLYRLTLRTAQGGVLWQWMADSGSRSLLATTPHSQIVWQAPLPAASGATLLLLAGDEPWFELPISAETLANSPRGCTKLEVELGWPMSADYVALSGTVLPLHDRIAQLENNCRDTASRLNQAQTDLAATQNRNQILEEASQAASRQRATWQQEATRLRNDLDELAQHLHNIETSTVFRATRPIVHAKMRLDRLLGRGPKADQPAKPARQPTPATPPQHPVDIIVPVYRGLADTCLCIESVLASVNQCAWRLIVINDASPEPEVTEWLRERAAQDSRITLLENAENLGFVGTVNRGMALSDSNDVLLLNSDTEVANDWLDRIRRAAYGDSKVASVTPFSNNATICSYPRFCKDNSLPAGYDTARLDALCAQTNPGAVVDVPTGVGFCMYIRRDCLAQVGLFDTENFGKGYGEENDFCQRAAEAGWRNLHLLDTFVLHTGGVSFGDTKSPRERAAMETLRRLHPRYERDVMAFVKADPAQPYRLALDIARMRQTHLPTVLAVLHDRAGGTVRHVRELATHLGEQALFLILTPAPDQCVRLQWADESEGFLLQFSLTKQSAEFLEALRRLGVAHIHYHHLLGHDESILDLPHQLGVQYDFTAHDFYSYCAHISLTGLDNRYAGDAAPGQCQCCRPESAAPQAGTIGQWRHRNVHFLTTARHVLAPSHDTARRISGFAPGARLLVVPHTDIGTDAPLPTPSPQARPDGFVLKVVVLGALSAIKGADLLESVAIEAARRNAPIEFHLLGYGYRHLQTQPRAHLTVHGAYEDKDLARLLAWLKPDLAWFPAQWPETYSYTLSACLEVGLPAVAPDLGAFAERLYERSWSWVERWNQTPAEWLDTFLRMREQNFANAQPPAALTLPAPLAHAVQAAKSSDAIWHYKDNYLQGINLPQSTAALPREFLEAHRAPVATGEGARSLLLSGVVRLRSHPLLRGVARRIPQHWQTRVKNWLSA